jgi:hypothetical protein
MYIVLYKGFGHSDVLHYVASRFELRSSLFSTSFRKGGELKMIKVILQLQRKGTKVYLTKEGLKVLASTK